MMKVLGLPTLGLPTFVKNIATTKINKPIITTFLSFIDYHLLIYFIVNGALTTKSSAQTSFILTT